MTDADPARRRWLALVLIRIGGAAGAVFGLALLARAPDGAWPAKALGIAIVLAALWMMAIVPRALARRWRSPEA